MRSGKLRLVLSFLFLGFAGGCEDSGPTNGSPIPSPTPAIGPTILFFTVVDYFHVDVHFSSAVDETSAETTANYSVDPDQLPGQEVASAERQDDTSVVRLSFAQPLLPIEYTLTVSDVENAEGTPIDAGTSAPFIGNGRVAFVTEAEGSGDLSTWADSGGLDGLEGANAVCQAEAEAAGFEGTFAAWLSDSATDAMDNVGLTSGPWIRTDGHAFAESMNDLLDRMVLVPLWLTASGERRTGDYAWTNTNPDGTLSSNHCTDWSTVAGSGHAGYLKAGTYQWTTWTTQSCSNTRPLYCFQTGEGPPVPPFAVTGKKVFVTSARGQGDMHTDWNTYGVTVPPGTTGTAAADYICSTMATSGGLDNPEKFKAWVSTAGQAAKDRFTYNGPWVLPNGVKVADSMADLTDGEIFSPVAYTQSMSPLGNYGVWTGTTEAGVLGTGTCTGWTVTTGTATIGRTGLATGEWTDMGTADCNSNINRLMCFEDE